MFDIYKKRLSVHGGIPSNCLKNAHDEAINASFCFDPNYKVCLINGYKIDAKFQRGSTTDVDDDRPYYHLEFRPDEPLLDVSVVNDVEIAPQVKIGAIIDIPEDHPVIQDYEWWTSREPDPRDRGCYVSEDGIHYRRWMIVDIMRYEQDRKYVIEECDWCLNWIDASKIRHRQLGVMRVRNSYSSGIYEKYYMTQIESQDSIWVPTTETTKTLTYDQRFLISDNELHPQAYKLSGIYTTKPVGLTKLILTQMVLDPVQDDAVNMLAGGLADYTDERDTVVQEPDDIPEMTDLFYVEGNVKEKVYIGYNTEFIATINEPANDELKHDYSYTWQTYLVKVKDGKETTKLFAEGDDSTEAQYIVSIPYDSRYVAFSMRTTCVVTCAQTGDSKTIEWNLPIDKM